MNKGKAYSTWSGRITFMAQDNDFPARLRKFPANTRAEEPRASGIQVSRGSHRPQILTLTEPPFDSSTHRQHLVRPGDVPFQRKGSSASQRKDLPRAVLI